MNDLGVPTICGTPLELPNCHPSELFRQVLRSLDAELQRIQQLEAHAAPAAPAPPGVPITTPVDELLEIGPGKEAWLMKCKAT